MSAQIVKNKMSVRDNVAYIFDGLVLFRLEKKVETSFRLKRQLLHQELKK